MRTSYAHLLHVIAEAMLAGESDRDGIVARMSSVLDSTEPWMASTADAAREAFSAQWADTPFDALARLIDLRSELRQRWPGDTLPGIARIIRRAAAQRPLPGRLAHLTLPSLTTLGDLAAWLELRDDDLGWLANRWRVEAPEANSPLHHYTYRAHEKRDGRFRLIERPKPLLRAAQHRLLHGLLDHVPPHEAAHGFRAGRSIVSFASPHVGNPLVIRLDLADFFVSVTAARVQALFGTLGYPQSVARAMTALVTNRVPSARFHAPDLGGRFDWCEQQRLRTRHLPQGASTSPALANLCAFRLDVRLAALARSLDARYTRYADDLAFSGGASLRTVAHTLPLRVAAIAIEEGFAVQPRKTRVMPRGVRQRLAGVVVNDHVNLSRDRFDALKATLTNCVRHGPASQNRTAHADFRASLAGQVAHAVMLNRTRGAKLQALFEQIDWSGYVAPRHHENSLWF